MLRYHFLSLSIISLIFGLALRPINAEDESTLAGVWRDDSGTLFTIVKEAHGFKVTRIHAESDPEAYQIKSSTWQNSVLKFTYFIPSTKYTISQEVLQLKGRTLLYKWINQKGDTGTDALERVNFTHEQDVAKPDIDLFEAAQKGDVNAIRRAIKAGANVNAVDNRLPKSVENFDAPSSPSKSTPLIYAVANGHPAAVDILIEAKANIEAQDAYGQTALKIARSAGNKKIIQKLQAAGAKK